MFNELWFQWVILFSGIIDLFGVGNGCWIGCRFVWCGWWFDYCVGVDLCIYFVRVFIGSVDIYGGGDGVGYDDCDFFWICLLILQKWCRCLVGIFVVCGRFIGRCVVWC